MFGRPLPMLQPTSRTALGATPVRVLVDGLEVTQAIQDMQHSVPLIARKQTIVRAYLSIESATSIAVRGELVIGSPGMSPVAVYSSNPVTIDPSINGQLRTKREDANLSLNFALPITQTNTGSLQVHLSRITRVLTGEELVIGGAPLFRTVQFVQGHALHVRILGLRYTDGQSPTTYEPTSLDYELIESWLRRAYPVPDVVFSRVIVNSNNSWPFDADQSNAHIAAIRRLDMTSGADIRVHYFGLVADAGGANFMRGKAAGIPQTPDPTTVASGPTGSNTWGWDLDGSYGDWYTGHELGHTFGRFHPGFCNGNSADDPQFPYPNGQISPATGDFVGFDVGDPSHGIAVRALPGVIWHDVMTYCDNQWLSAYTYTGIRDRIAAEDQITPAPSGVGGPIGHATMSPKPDSAALPSVPVPGTLRVAQGKFLNIVATVNLTKQTGKIQYVQPIEMAQLREADANSSTRLRIRNAKNAVIREEPVELRLSSCPMPGEDRSGLVDAILPYDAEARFVDLILNGNVIDTYAGSAVQLGVSGLRVVNARQPGNLALAWDIHHTPTSTVAYSVQVSTDDAKTWQTVAVRQPEPNVEIDLHQFRPAKKIQVRVIASDGFSSHTTSHQEIPLN